jgi:hypothetical protein
METRGARGGRKLREHGPARAPRDEKGGYLDYARRETKTILDAESRPVHVMPDTLGDLQVTRKECAARKVALVKSRRGVALVPQFTEIGSRDPKDVERESSETNCRASEVSSVAKERSDNSPLYAESDSRRNVRPREESSVHRRR